MKPLSKFSKTILTLGFIISMVNMLTYWFPIFSIEMLKSFENLALFNKIAGIISAAVFITVLIRIWKSKIIEADIKTMWTVMLLLLQGVFGIYFIWRLDHKGNIR